MLGDDGLAEEADVAALHRVEAEDRAGQGGLAAADSPTRPRLSPS
jgi:hypothetical protein